MKEVTPPSPPTPSPHQWAISGGSAFSTSMSLARSLRSLPRRRPLLGYIVLKSLVFICCDIHVVRTLLRLVDASTSISAPVLVYYNGYLLIWLSQGVLVFITEAIFLEIPKISVGVFWQMRIFMWLQISSCSERYVLAAGPWWYF